MSKVNILNIDIQSNIKFNISNNTKSVNSGYYHISSNSYKIHFRIIKALLLAYGVKIHFF